MYHNKVEQLFEFLKSHSSIFTWTDFGEAIVNGIHLPGTNVHEMLDYLFHDWQQLSKQSPTRFGQVNSCIVSKRFQSTECCK